jgi:hypothetical protein
MPSTAKPTRPATKTNHLAHDVEARQAAGLVVSKVDRLSTTRTGSTPSSVARSARLESGRGGVGVEAGSSQDVETRSPQDDLPSLGNQMLAVRRSSCTSTGPLSRCELSSSSPRPSFVAHFGMGIKGPCSYEPATLVVDTSEEDNRW